MSVIAQLFLDVLFEINSLALGWKTCRAVLSHPVPDDLSDLPRRQVSPTDPAVGCLIARRTRTPETIENTKARYFSDSLA